MKCFIITGAILLAPLAMAKPVNFQSARPSLVKLAAAAGKNITSDGPNFEDNVQGPEQNMHQCIVNCWVKKIGDANKIGDADTMKCTWDCMNRPENTHFAVHKHFALNEHSALNE
ncbi:hypothetical protein COL26b_003411 [Colletotrichum chrysophilum]|uniref:uncharacterized protein n=1 Tax=Colletotrichum chrysophilum TaxID=1836956 RepID=UPI00230199A9|nr:uncharacterized protein COL26b_003411 [Colletotrichum chrysophilum]KAJ0378251.1 hypothetical protein COL26b_003411 [Colletotrichum chrysophilum]